MIIQVLKDNITKSLIEADLKMDIWDETEDLITNTVIEEDITQ
ncbi:hypothetical protein V6B33_01365 [Mangrovibacillus sp. Mu-81]